MIGLAAGLTRTVAAIVPYVGAALVARFAGPAVAEAVGSATGLDERIAEWVSSSLGAAAWESQYQQWLSDPMVQQALAGQGFGAVGDLVALPGGLAGMGAHYVLLIGTSILLFVVAKIGLSLIFRGVLATVRNISVLRSVDRLGGAAVGLGVGLAIATLVAVVWTPASSALSKGVGVDAAADQSMVRRHWLPLLGLDETLFFKAAEDWLAPLFAQRMPSFDIGSALPVGAHYPHDGGAPAPVTPLSDLFAAAPQTYVETELSAAVDCKAGQCPDWEIDAEPRELDCWFCDSPYVGVRGDQFVLDSDGSVGVDTLAGCTKRTEGPILRNLDVVEQTAERLVVRGVKQFEKSQLGSCSGNVEYQSTVRVTVEWVFNGP